MHGFRRFRCRACGRRFNERTGTALNRVQVPTDIVFLVRGTVFTQEAVRDWEAKLASSLSDALRERRSGKIGRCRHVDETYLKAAGDRCHLYRAIDRDGTPVDVYLSEARDSAAARAFFRSARSVTQAEPGQVTICGRPSARKSKRLNVVVGSLALICPACSRART